MQQSASFLCALKRCLKARGLTYADLASRLDLSEASVKRVFAEGTLTLERIGQVLDILEMSFLDVAKLSASLGKPQPDVLTYDQESILATDPKLFAVFHLVLFGKTLNDIVDTYDLSRKEAERHLATLEEIGLIERLAHKIKVLSGKAVTWRDDGPLRNAYKGQLLNEFLNDDFGGARELTSFMMRSLSPGSQALINRKLDLLKHEIEELSAIDAVALKGKTQTTALLVAMRPFSFSIVGSLKKRRS